MTKIFLIDELRYAKIKAPNKNYVDVQNVSIKLNNRSTIFQHPNSRIEFRSQLLTENPKLYFGCGIRPNVWKKLNHSIVFEIFAKTFFRKPKRIFYKEVFPKDLSEQGWLDFQIDLTEFANKNTQIIFSTSIPENENTDYCWSVWGNPEIEHHPKKLIAPSSKPKSAHVFFITSDALRQDYLGAYGNKIIKTPNCDQIAKDGILFNHARVQTVSTIGSYASMLLSQSPLKHTVLAEWGAITKGFQSLPEFLHSHGYKTMLVPSELELIEPKAGLISLFDEVVACYGNPSQDGKITTRLAIEQIEKQTQPTFFWIQYFDTHPPVMPPEPYSSMYYSGDPTAENNRYQSDAVKLINGVETLQEFQPSLPFLGQGEIDEFLVAKLEATVYALRGEQLSDPDLAIHIKNIGPKMHKHIPLHQFADWLEEQVRQLRAGFVPQELLHWIDEIYPLLQEINQDILTWLEGVIDFRYPLAQYASSVSYFDSHVGNLISYLKQNDLYDQSLIILTSPHGEILDEHGMYFHHHTLVEECVRVPMIIKPAKQTSFQPETRIDGIFDALDLFPTITDLLGLPLPQNLEGFSRMLNIYDGSAISQHDSFSINNSYTMASIVYGNYKLIKADKDHINAPTWRWRKGDKVLFDLRDKPFDTKNIINDLSEIANDMEKRLDLWLEEIK